MSDQNTGVELIAAERQRQIESEGWTPEHDDYHDDESLALAAVCYAAPVPVFRQYDRGRTVIYNDPWPESWSEDWDKRPVDPVSAEERIRALTKAGALIAAEIDRIMRRREENRRQRGRL